MTTEAPSMLGHSDRVSDTHLAQEHLLNQEHNGAVTWFAGEVDPTTPMTLTVHDPYGRFCHIEVEPEGNLVDALDQVITARGLRRCARWRLVRRDEWVNQGPSKRAVWVTDLRRLPEVGRQWPPVPRDADDLP
jgi:hypothetical protein